LSHDPAISFLPVVIKLNIHHYFTDRGITMKRTPLLTLLAVFILSLVLVTAVLAAADSTRQKAVLAEGINETILESDFSIPVELDSEEPSLAGKSAAAVDVADSQPPQIVYYRGLPPEFAHSSSAYEMGPFDPANFNNSGSAPVFAQDSGMDALRTPPMPRDDNIVIQKDEKLIWGVVNPGDTVTVTVEGSQMGAAVADDVGFFWTTLYDSNGDLPAMGTGDTVVVYANGVEQANVDLPAIQGTIDTIGDVVSGHISNYSFNVTVYADGRSMTSYWVTTTLDASGYFTAEFDTVWDFQVRDKVFVAAVKDGVEVHTNSLQVRPGAWNIAEGRAEPNTPVTVTLFDSDDTPIDGEVLGADVDGWWEWETGTSFEEEDYVQVEFEGGDVISRTVDHLTGSMDAVNNRLTGESKANIEVRGYASALTEEGMKSVQLTTTSDANGFYTIEFGVDKPPLYWSGVFIADTEGDDLALFQHDANVQVNQTYNDVSGLGPIPIGDSAGMLVTVTFASDPAYFVTEMNWYGFYYFDPGAYEGFPDITPGEIVTVAFEGHEWQGVVPVDVITATPDVILNRITGEVSGSGDYVEVYGEHWGWSEVPPLYPIAGSFDSVTTASSPYSVTPPGFDIRNAVLYHVRHYVTEDGIDAVSGNVDSVRVYPNYNGLSGSISPGGTAYTITLKEDGGGDKAVINGNSPEQPERFWEPFWNTGEMIEFGDIIEIQAENGFNQVIQVPAMDVQFDLAGDRIIGNVLPNVSLYVNIDDQGNGFVPTQENGNFAVSIGQLQQFWGNGDLEWGSNIQVCLATEAGNQICYVKNWPSITARYTNMGWNDVFGNDAIGGNPILITVTDEVDAGQPGDGRLWG
jgi:hypothetical protein